MSLDLWGFVFLFVALRFGGSTAIFDVFGAAGFENRFDLLHNFRILGGDVLHGDGDAPGKRYVSESAIHYLARHSVPEEHNHRDYAGAEQHDDECAERLGDQLGQQTIIHVVR